MPEQFDEAWEYWVPDPEIVEVMESNVGHTGGFDLVTTWEESPSGKNRVSGLRFGSGNPDHGYFRLGKERLSNNVGRPRELKDKVCPNCRLLFRPRNSRAMYCSTFCFAEVRRLPDRKCQWCGDRYTPNHSWQKYCDAVCHASHRDDLKRSPDALCATCEVPFRRLVYRTKYCSRQCVPHKGRGRVLPDRQCDGDGCGVLFRPKRRSNRYCSLGCRPTGASYAKLPDVLCEREGCGVRFAPGRKDRRFCSLECAQVCHFVRHDTGCPGCGGPVPVARNKNGVPKKYCSTKCKGDVRKRVWWERHGAKYREQRREKHRTKKLSPSSVIPAVTS